MQKKTRSKGSQGVSRPAVKKAVPGSKKKPKAKLKPKARPARKK